MSMHNLYLLSNHNVSKDREEREDSGKGRGAVDDQERYMVNFEAVCEIPYAGSSIVCVRYYYDFVASVDELRGQLVNVAFDAARLGKEEVADHGNVVRHVGWRS